MIPGFTVRVLERATSSNDAALAAIREGAASDCLVFQAIEQTAGRGRRGREWISPTGNLHCSFVLDIQGVRSTAPLIGFAAAVALTDALNQLVPTQGFRCKWPNDVMAASGAKVAGMLLESHDDRWLVLGIGVDVAHAPPPDRVERPAMSLAQLGWHGDAATVLDALCRHLGPLLALWRGEGFAPVRSQWLQRAQGLGQKVTVRLDNECIDGIFASLDLDGALILEMPSGERRKILAGDVFSGVEGGNHASGH